MLLIVLTDQILLEKGILCYDYLICSLFYVLLRIRTCFKVPNSSGSQLASAKAAQHRLDRGVWTSVRLGDMRRSLAGMNFMCLSYSFLLSLNILERMHRKSFYMYNTSHTHHWSSFKRVTFLLPFY